MTTIVNTDQCKTFSELQGMADSNALNENMGRLSEKSEVLEGSGVLFAPLPGFFFGSCGPMRVESPLLQSVYFDEHAFAVMLVLDGSAKYTVAGKEEFSVSLCKNMVIAGCWEDAEVRTIYPKQESYSHIGFLVSQTVLEAYFGKAASKQIRDLIRKKGNAANIVAGPALSDTVLHVQKAIVDIQNGSVADLLALRGGALNCFVKLVDAISHLGTNLASYPPNQTDVERIAALKEYIDTNFLEVDTVRDVHSRFGMSLSKANNLFKSQYGVTIAQYIHGCKMAYAYSRLVARECNVTECAMEVGYSNISHFITSFKRTYNLTPKAVTRLHVPLTQGMENCARV
ncbi:helix-turn-helix transcriptional regulator [Pseudodesulfovibrio alkaliphilus]|nr:AraC family transcriptional regulator [Pseudodesulfovibrio alkaliphilus]